MLCFTLFDSGDITGGDPFRRVFCKKAGSKGPYPVQTSWLLFGDETTVTTYLPAPKNAQRPYRSITLTETPRYLMTPRFSAHTVGHSAHLRCGLRMPFSSVSFRVSTV